MASGLCFATQPRSQTPRVRTSPAQGAAASRRRWRLRATPKREISSHPAARGTNTSLTMRPLFLCLLLGWFPGCAHHSRNIHSVWQGGIVPKPAATLPAPAGFSITPAQAHAIVWESRMLSLKHHWHLYADTQYYYMLDTFLGDSPRKAYRVGVRIDGKPGEIAKRPQ